MANVHPPGWKNPEPAGRYNLVVIGAGTAGLVSAAGAAGLGAKAALVERHLIGGDCLNAGCVPSKCVIRSSRSWADVREAHLFGMRVGRGSPLFSLGSLFLPTRYAILSLTVDNRSNSLRGGYDDGYLRERGPTNP